MRASRPRAGDLARFDVAVIEGEDDLRRLIPAWWSLWSRTESATPFASPAWLLPWWRSFRPGRLLTVAVRSCDRLVGLLPAYVEDGEWGRRLLPLGIGVSDYLDLLIDKSVPGAAAALVDAVIALSDRYDSWELDELCPEADGLALPIPDVWTETRAQSACPVLRLGDLEAWPRTRPGRRWRRAWNRLDRHAAVAVEAATPATVHRFVDDLIALHGHRWSEAGQSGVLVSPQVQAFHRSAAPDLLEAGLLQMFRLNIGKRCIGIYYGFLRGRRAYGYLSGFDPDWAFESPGTALVGHAMVEAIRRGCDEFHFLRGQEPYKYAWGAMDRWNTARTVRPLPRRDHTALDDAPAPTAAQ